MNIDARAIQEFRETYLVSNTPLYLYKMLRRLPAVQHLASAMRGDELVAEYRRRVKMKERTADDVATSYACLVALTYRDPREAVSLLRSLDLTGLEWGPAMRELCYAKMPVGRSYYIEITSPSLPTMRQASDATNSSDRITVPGPKVPRKANL